MSLLADTDHTIVERPMDLKYSQHDLNSSLLHHKDFVIKE